ncbi:MAG: 6-phosphofructokinase [Candidatus Bathyarchaeota archaeon]|nr:6-phosphofructokinase [Candidatus Bathyarchaeota archaeon]
MKTVGVLTTGGDAPGMNATIRAVTRIAHSRNLQVLGFERGWEGLLTNTFRQLTPRSVGGIVQLGGTMLHTSRCPEFKTEEGLEKAAETLALHKVDGLVVIGGNGSFKGASELSKRTSALIVGIPATIDNDVFGSDETVGFDTAINTAVTAIDKIRDTAISHERIFIVEVMGRERGFLAVNVGISVGAEIILIPEQECKLETILEVIRENTRKGKKAGIIVAAEGVGNTGTIAKEIEKHTSAEVRLSILGYAQRGGSPTARSRLLAGLFAEKAVDVLCGEEGNCVVGLQGGRVTGTNLKKSSETQKPLDLSLMKLAEMLAT